MVVKNTSNKILFKNLNLKNRFINPSSNSNNIQKISNMYYLEKN